MKREPGKKRTILLAVITAFTNPCVAHIKWRPFHANSNSLLAGVDTLSSHRAMVWILCFIPSYTPQMIVIPSRTLWQCKGFCFTLCRLPCLRSWTSRDSEEQEMKQNRSSGLWFCPPYRYHRGVTGKSPLLFPRTAASVCGIYEGSLTAERSPAQRDAKQRLLFAFRVAKIHLPCFRFQLS